MFSETELLTTAKASPTAVAAHDRASWLGLFSRDAEVHDPVGSRGHAGPAALARFYDTFIAPNDIHFAVEHDLVCGQTVVRDLVIETRMGGTPLQVNVPLFIRYEIVDDNGQPKVRRLYAHWELMAMMGSQVFNQGLGTGLLALIKLSGNMLRHQGIGGALGFSRAFAGVGKKAKLSTEAFLEAMSQGDDHRARTVLAPHCPLQIGTSPVGLAEMKHRLKTARWEKMLAGGQQVTVRLHLNDGQRAVGLFDIARDGHRLAGVRIYLPDITR